MSARSLRFFLLAPLIALTACRESKVTAYRIPKEKEAEMPAGHPPASMPGDATSGAPAGAPGGDMMNAPVPTVDGPGLVWTAPADWKLMPAAPMRKATYSVPGPGGAAELTITAFPGQVGGELANINRWRGQVGAAPLAEAELDQNVDRTEINGLHFVVADITDAQNPKGTLGALVPYSGGFWFFKLTGPTATVKDQKPAFSAFLKTVKAAQP